MEPLTERESALLATIAAGQSRVQQRKAEIIRLAFQDLQPADIADRLKLSKRRVYHWLREFRHRRMAIFSHLSEHTAQSSHPDRVTIEVAPAEPGRDRAASDAAGVIFDATLEQHQLEPRYRQLLTDAVQLASFSSTSLRTQLMANYEPDERTILAALITNQNKAKFDATVPELASDANRALSLLSVLLQMGISLQASEIELVVSGQHRLEILVRSPADKPNRLRKAASVWSSLVNQKVSIIANPSRYDLAARLAGAPLILPDTPFDQALRQVLIYYLELIQSRQADLLADQAIETLIALQQTIRGARHIFRAMGEQFDVTEIEHLPRELRWLSKNCRPLRRWLMRTGQVESYLVNADEPTQGVQEMLQAWQDQLDTARVELLQLCVGSRYQDFVAAARQFIQTKNAGIFGKTASRDRLCYVLPGMLWEQYQQLRSMEINFDWGKGKRVRDLRRGVRDMTLYLSHFQAILGPAGARCILILTSLDEYLTFFIDTDSMMAAATEYMQKAEKKERHHSGIEALITTLQKEKANTARGGQELWQMVLSQPFRQDLGLATAEL